jgi:tight adherence protein B
MPGGRAVNVGFLLSGLVAVGAARRAVVGARAARAVARRAREDAAVAPRPSSAVAAAIAAAIAAVVALRGGPVTGAFVVAVALAVPVSTRQARARLAAAHRHEQLADAVEALARAIRAGTPVVDALDAAATGPGVGVGLAAAARQVRHGVGLVEALDGWAADAALDGADLVASAFAVTARAGGDPGPALLAVADTLRERRALQRELRALSSQARLSSAVIAVAPVAFAAFAAAVDPATAGVLLGTPLGLSCVVAGAALDAVGWRWMARITGSVA